MSEYSNKKRPQKDYNRDLLFTSIKRPVRHYFCLPSIEEKCVALGFKKKIFGRKTFITAIEKEPGIAEYLKDTGIYGHVFNGKVENFRKPPQNAPLIDFANIDMCTELNHETLTWLKTMMPFWAKDCVISLTVAAPKRVPISLTGQVKSGALDPYIKYLPKPNYCTDFVDKKDGDVSRISALINEAIRFDGVTIAKRYNDGQQGMIIIAGYRGKPQMPYEPPGYTEYMDAQAYLDKLHRMPKRAINQQIRAHMTMRWNKLKPGQKAAMKIHNGHKLERLGIE